MLEETPECLRSVNQGIVQVEQDTSYGMGSYEIPWWLLRDRTGSLCCLWSLHNSPGDGKPRLSKMLATDAVGKTSLSSVGSKNPPVVRRQ